jgi:hypothetical protein
MYLYTALLWLCGSIPTLHLSFFLLLGGSMGVMGIRVSQDDSFPVPQPSTAFHGIPWASMGLHGLLWAPLES